MGKGRGVRGEAQGQGDEIRNGPNVAHTRHVQPAAAGGPSGEANGAPERDEARDGEGGPGMEMTRWGGGVSIPRSVRATSSTRSGVL